ncbi:alpha/beta fold hydrolase [Demequina mangrovi]|uniref:Pimeloyl-ACP methyl ester carboxylesterase n=1 Tax=Demequina mangrovi TaxID=1043493 RepID=A0A1H6X9T0_9MICO|nr:alpha/beta hydrolase [Demequina mangrovi]SEJ25961.1 Pimeloyl-ACP methyl ester carboxylesterase [Demequina mangrovi]
MTAVVPRVSRRDDARYREAEQAVWAHHGMTPVERWVDVPGYGIRVRALEHGEGRPVVLIHGNPTAGNVFVPLVAALSGVRAIVVDRPGCGLSDPLDYSDMTPEGLRSAVAAYVEAVIGALVDGPVDLLGNSAGGGAAVLAAARLPALVRSVVIEGVPAIRGMRLPRELRLTALSPIARLVAGHKVNEADLRRSFRAMGHGSLIDAGGPPPEELAWRMALSRYTDTYWHELSLIRRTATLRGLRPEWVAGKEELEALRMPSLWIVGDLDPFAAPERVRAWAGHATRASVHVMEGSGHQPWLDDPDRHARMIHRWWAEQVIV